jgi:hypothetical protein
MSDAITPAVSSQPESSAPAASAPESSGPDWFGSEDSGDEEGQAQFDQAGDAAAAPQEEPPPQGQPEALIMGKFRNQEDMIRSYQELERAHTQAAQAAAERQRQVEWMMQNFQAPQQQQAPQQPPSDYFHEWREEQQRAAFQEFSDDYAQDPALATFKYLANLNNLVDQRIQKTVGTRDELKRSSIEAYQQSAKLQADVNNHITNFKQQNPRMQEPEVEARVAQVINEMVNDGSINAVFAAGREPLDFAFNYVLGTMQSSDVQKLAQAEAEKKLADQKARDRFQLSASGSNAPKNGMGPSSEPDWFGLNSKK